jgi:hypothetical protein
MFGVEATNRGCLVAESVQKALHREDLYSPLPEDRSDFGCALQVVIPRDQRIGVPVDRGFDNHVVFRVPANSHIAPHDS